MRNVICALLVLVCICPVAMGAGRWSRNSCSGGSCGSVPRNVGAGHTQLDLTIDVQPSYPQQPVRSDEDGDDSFSPRFPRLYNMRMNAKGRRQAVARAVLGTGRAIGQRLLHR